MVCTNWQPSHNMVLNSIVPFTASVLDEQGATHFSITFFRALFENHTVIAISEYTKKIKELANI